MVVAILVAVIAAFNSGVTFTLKAGSETSATTTPKTAKGVVQTRPAIPKTPETILQTNIAHETAIVSTPTVSTTPREVPKKTLYIFAAQKSETVLDAMHDFAATNQFDFKTKDFPGMGVMIESINDLENGDGYYWILYINGKDSAKGASAAQVNTGDSIEWRYEQGY